jgi:hypothetical protein
MILSRSDLKAQKYLTIANADLRGSTLIPRGQRGSTRIYADPRGQRGFTRIYADPLRGIADHIGKDQQIVDALRSRKPDLAETKVYVDPVPGPATGGHTFNRRVSEKTLERDDSPDQRDSWNRT